MKTPMQELIEQLKQLKYSEINEQAWDAYDSVMDLAEAMLEKEKEVIIDAANFDSRSISENGYRKGEQYYNETFNTKEK